MKKFIGFCFAFVLFTMAGNAQLEVVKVANETTKKECTKSVEECAAKMGISVEECKKMCKSNAKLASSTKCATSSKACKKAGLTKVASAVMVEGETTEVKTVPAKSSKKQCTKSNKACCKKKG